MVVEDHYDSSEEDYSPDPISSVVSNRRIVLLLALVYGALAVSRSEKAKFFRLMVKRIVQTGRLLADELKDERLAFSALHDHLEQRDEITERTQRVNETTSAAAER